jgi:hypothetical protein
VGKLKRTQQKSRHLTTRITINYSRNSSVGIVTSLRAGRPRNYGSAPGRCKRFSFLEVPERFWGPPNPLFCWDCGLLSLGTEQQEHEFDHVAPSMSRLRTIGGVPLLISSLFAPGVLCCTSVTCYPNVAFLDGFL